MHALPTAKIISKLRALGVDYDQERFIEELKQLRSVSAVADHWMENHPIAADGFDVDFIWMGARVLWERLAPDLVVTERLDDQCRRDTRCWKTANPWKPVLSG